MNFDFSSEQRALQDEVRGFLREASPLSCCRKALESQRGFDADLWRQMGELGWLGICIPERFGGSGLSALELALTSEEVGRALSPIPFGSSICGAAGSILRDGSEAQQERWLPSIATGEQIGVLGIAERPGSFNWSQVETRLENGRLSGTKIAVADGAIATFAVVACRGEAELALVSLDQQNVRRETLRSIDPSRSVANLHFAGAHAEALGGKGAFDSMWLRCAASGAFEQLGGADAVFAITREHMNVRHAFGKPISSYQALKHRMADLFAALEVARSNAYYAAWAASADSVELAESVCCARVSASQAYQLATFEAIQFQGGMGFTWESDCHLFYRRAKWLSASLGGPDYWRERLLVELDAATV
jgi:acyl-CoA dehydrogenase